MHDLHLDFETYCDLDLKKVGIQRYVEHPSFVVLCVGWQLDGGARQWAQGITPELAHYLTRADVQTHAWNAAFETAVLEHLGQDTANPLSCTMQRALAYGLPGSLGLAGMALGCRVQKSATGHRLMMRLCRPDKNGARPVPTAQEICDLGDYCSQDAASEAAIGAVIPKLSPEEHVVSVLDAAMNWTGVGIDRVRVGMLKAAAILAEADDSARCDMLTSGAVTSPGTQTARLLAWFQAQGLSIENVARNSIEDALAMIPLPGSTDCTITEAVREVLQIRLRTARGSTKKLNRMLDMADHVGRLCYQFQYCGAGRTGRWSGRGIQPQNLPRVPKGFSPDKFVELASAAMTSAAPKALNVIAPAPVLDCVSWSLRSCLEAPGDADMWGFDFSQIEARVLAWLAGQSDVLGVFRAGEDVYKWAAMQFGSTDRQLGKVLILALGFGMGATKLRETAQKNYGVSLTLLQAEKFKNAWRNSNHRIVGFWDDIAFAARQAVVSRGRTYAVGAGTGLAFHCTPRTLQLRLPSGRVLYYHKPRLDTDGSLVYWGTGTGGRWEEQRTYGGKLAENATQAVARDVMSEAMTRIWRRLTRVPLMTIHDEIVYSLARVLGDDIEARNLEALALEPPQWAGGLPIAGESKIMRRYSVPV